MTVTANHVSHCQAAQLQPAPPLRPQLLRRRKQRQQSLRTRVTRKTVQTSPPTQRPRSGSTLTSPTTATSLDWITITTVSRVSPYLVARSQRLKRSSAASSCEAPPKFPAASGTTQGGPSVEDQRPPPKERSMSLDEVVVSPIWLETSHVFLSQSVPV